MQEYSSFWSNITHLSTSKKPTIAFSDSTDPRILSAIKILGENGNIQPLLIGKKENIDRLTKENGLPPLDQNRILDLYSEENTYLITKTLAECQKSIDEVELNKQAKDTLYQGVSLLLQGKIEGLISGSTRPTGDVIKAAIKCVGPKKGVRFVSGQFLIESKKMKTSEGEPFLMSDCAVVPEPSSRVLALISKGAAEAYRFFVGKEPKVALLSFSTRGSADHKLVDKIREALKILQDEKVNFSVDGELQLDAAIDAEVAKIKNAMDSKVAPEANVFIYPSLESGNIGYKLIQRFSECRIAGPILWGLDKPMSDLSRGCTVQEIVDTTYCVAKLTEGKN